MDSVQRLISNPAGDARPKHILKNQILIHQGATPDQAFIVKDGIIKMYDIDDQGNEKILHLLQSPAVFPFSSFTQGNVATRWFYTALTDCNIYAIPKEQFRSKLANDSELSLYLMDWFSKEMHEILTRLNSLSKTVAHGKITAALRYLLTRHSTEQNNGWSRVDFPVSHQLLADMAGITRESATITMKDFQTKQIVRSPQARALEIHGARLCNE